ncbi:MAG: cell wall metabolism sensor histidine kinase WalK [Planctomycetaceae bacterium]|nr:cell wall metabolism sensor histidine kinase WalK [Planctomycetaceae bacterium]
MQSRSLFAWFFIGNLILVTLVLTLAGSFTSDKILRQANQKSEILQKELVRAQRVCLESLWTTENTANRNERIQNFCREFNNGDNQSRLTVVDLNGHVLGDSEENPEEMEPCTPEHHPEIGEALKGRFGESLRQSETMHGFFRYFAEPIRTNDNKIAGAARLAMPVSGIKEIGQAFFSGIVVNFLMAFLAGVPLMLVFAWLWYRPIRELHAAAMNISHGNLETPVPVSGPIELAHLASAMEQMRKTVSSQLETIETQKNNLRAILNELNEAIFATDAEDRLLFINRAAENLFAISPPEKNTLLQSILRYGTLLSFYERAKSHTDDSLEQVQIDLCGKRRLLDLRMSNISQESTESGLASLLIVSDQTEAARTTAMKVEFVANASHELRTPLATIRAAVDNLLDNIDGDPGTLRRLADILDRHVGRLEAMVRDLLDLHLVENSHIPNRFEMLQTKEIRDDIYDLFRAKLLEKGVTLRIETVPTGFPSDPNRLHLILQNIVDNAIKFSPAGSEVLLQLTPDKNNLTISCRDRGCGIPKEEQKKVFDRFYQVKGEKSGDNRVRGTGLGLAIVKHATERLGGSIHLESRPGTGTTITIPLPILAADMS